MTESRTWSIEWYHFHWPWKTTNQNYKLKGRSLSAWL